MAAGLTNVMIEVRQDLVETQAGAARWAEVLERALRPVLAELALFQRSAGGVS
jgi:predicted N-formylglutamate amidohydrolase